MSETTSTPRSQAHLLVNFVVTLLTPMFLAAADGNLAHARHAAIETLNGWRAETGSDLITVAKIIGFGLATLAALSRSLAEDLPTAILLRLHASANATDRSEHRNRQTLQHSQSRPPLPAPEPDIDEAALHAASEAMKIRTAQHLAQFTIAEPAPAPHAAPTTPASAQPAPAQPAPANSEAERQYQATWAASAATIAAETAAALPTMPPEERASAAIWIEVLNDVAKEFMAGNGPPRTKPGDLAAMLRSTAP